MLSQRLKNYKLILASGSPRRQQFFREMNLDFEIRLQKVDEIFPIGLKSHEITDYLAQLKAKTFDLKENEIVVTSDTIVWFEEKALGKPKDYDEAFEFLRKLSGKIHEVISSVCIKSNLKNKVFNAVTSVKFAELSDSVINYYLENYKPFDKAGAYGIQDWLGVVAIEKIEGSYTNVMGFPTEKFYRELLCFVR